MHYFKRNIGDYHKKAGKLSMLEHGAYTLLLDSCYDRERFPTKEEAIEWCWARTDEEIKAVEFVLSRFFILEDGIYIQHRIQEEIEAYHAKALKNKEIAIERENKRKTNRTRIVHEPPPNQEPLTINQEPIKENRAKKFAPPSLRDVTNYCIERGNKIDPGRFISYYEANGWMVGRNKMKDWKAAIRNWETRGNANEQHQKQSTSRTARVTAELQRIAAEDIAKNGFTDKLG